VGSALYDRCGGRFEFTQDVVKPVAKRGRVFTKSERLTAIDVNRVAETVSGARVP